MKDLKFSIRPLILATTVVAVAGPSVNAATIGSGNMLRIENNSGWSMVTQGAGYNSGPQYGNYYVPMWLGSYDYKQYHLYDYSAGAWVESFYCK